MYLFPLEDLRRSGTAVRDARGWPSPSPPSGPDRRRASSAETSRRHHESEWKRAVHRDAGSWFDLEDVRDHYAGELFGADMARLWRNEPERALDLGRAAVAEVVAAAIAEWRRPGSPCAGLLTEALRDLRAGPGLGAGRLVGPAQGAVVHVGPGLGPGRRPDHRRGGQRARRPSGQRHRRNRSTAPCASSLHTAAHQVERVTRDVVVPARGGVSVHADSLFDGFRDLTYAYCFGPRSYELVTVDLLDASGTVLATTGYLPGGPARDLDPDVGLQARIEPADEGTWLLEISTRRFAEYVQVDVPGFVAADSWFHLPRGDPARPSSDPSPGPPRQPRGRVRALEFVDRRRRWAHEHRPASTYGIACCAGTLPHLALTVGCMAATSPAGTGRPRSLPAASSATGAGKGRPAGMAIREDEVGRLVEQSPDAVVVPAGNGMAIDLGDHAGAVAKVRRHVLRRLLIADIVGLAIAAVLEPDG